MLRFAICVLLAITVMWSSLVSAQKPGTDNPVVANLNGVETTHRIKQAVPATKVLFLSVFNSYLEEGIAAGADGYLLKDCEPEDLLRELRRIAGPTRDDV